MATPTVQDQVAALLSRKVAEKKVRGTPSPDIEAAALFESVAVNLLLHPRAVLYFAWLARNGLLKVVADELKAIEQMRKAVDDLSNVSYALTDTRPLERARGALTHIEGQDRLMSSGTAFGRYDQAVRDALGLLSTNVVAPGATELTRPAQEAEADLPALYGAVQALHSEVLDRLYSLAVGVQNFLSTPALSILGISTVQNVRLDIEQMIEAMKEDPSAEKSREFALRLVAGRAALRALGTPPSFSADDQSGLAVMWRELKPAVESGLMGWLNDGFSVGLARLDMAVAGLSAAAPAGQIAEAKRVLGLLETALQSLVTALQVTRPTGFAEEKRVADGILSSLEERGYDRAVAMLLRCRVAEVFQLDWQTASFAGTLMKAGSDIARSDLRFPNRERDEVTLTAYRGQ